MGLLDSLAGGLVNNLKDTAATKMLEGLRDNVLGEALTGIGKITSISYSNKKLRIALVLCGLEEREIRVSCGRIAIADDGSSISLGDFDADIEFARTLLSRFLEGRQIPLPDGKARLAARTAKNVFSL